MVQRSAMRWVVPWVGAERGLGLLMVGEVGHRAQGARKALLFRKVRPRALTDRSDGAFGERDHFRR